MNKDLVYTNDNGLINPKYENKLIGKISFKYIIPLMAGMIFSQTVPLVDALCLSREMNETVMSALGTVGPLFYIINIIGAVFGIGCGISISKCSGSGDKERAARIFSLSVILMALVTLIFCIVCAVFSDHVLNILSATPENYEYAKTYLLIILAGSIFIVFNFAGDYILMNDGNPKLAFAGDATGAIVNAVVDIIGVRFFHMGIEAVAFGSIFGSFCCCLVYLLHFRKKDRLCRFAKPQLKKDDPGIIDIIKPGTVEAVIYLILGVQIVVQNFVLASEAGTSGLGNATVIDNIGLIFGTIITGTTDPIMTFASAYFGEQNRMGLNMVKRTLFIIGSIMLLPFAVLVFSFPQFCINLYKIDDALMVSSLPTAIRMITVALLLMFVATMFVDYLSAVEEETKAGISLAINGVSLIVLTVLLAKPFSYNAPWVAKIISGTLQLLYLLLVCRFLMRGMMRFQKENVLLLDGGDITEQLPERWIEGIRRILGEEEAESVRTKMLVPVLSSLAPEEHLTASFTALQREDRKIAVILRYDSKKNYQKENEMDITEKDESVEIVYSEFLSIQRVMMLFDRKERQN